MSNLQNRFLFADLIQPSNLRKLPSIPKMSAWERGLPGRRDSLALCLGGGVANMIMKGRWVKNGCPWIPKITGGWIVFHGSPPGLLHQPVLVLHHLGAPLA